MTPPTATCIDLGMHRSHLLRYARHKLRDAALAEDLVHDVLEAVIAGRAAFGRRSSPRTWLIGILKHKIVDAVRSDRGECSLDALLDDAGDAALPCVEPADPSELAAQRQALGRALNRLQALPESQRCAFERCVVFGESGAEACRALGITPGNLWVRVHRARQALLAA